MSGRTIDIFHLCPPYGMENEVLEAWCEARGLAGILDEKPAVLEPWLEVGGDKELDHYCRRLRSLRQLWQIGDSRSRGIWMKRRTEHIRKTVSAYIGFRLGRERDMNRRAETWGISTGDRKLDEVSTLLRSFLGELTTRNPGVEAPVFIKHVHLEIDPRLPGITASLLESNSYLGDDITFSLDLGFLDSEKLGVNCSCRGSFYGEEHLPCRHQRVLLEWTLDALHDPEDELHEELITMLKTERWKFVLDEWAEEARQHLPVRKGAGDERLGWRIGVENSRLELFPIIRKRAARGGWTQGRRAHQGAGSRQLGSKGGEADRRLLLLMDRYEYYHMIPTRIDTG